MGMSASQARFLSITARLSDNELKQQSLAYSKQRLSESAERVNDQYLEALNKTKYQILTGYNGNTANYENVTYNQITGCNTVACGKQYLVKNNQGKVLVSSAIAKAFESGNGDFNKFLESQGAGKYTQVDIDTSASLEAEEKIHEAWDKYLASVGKGINNYDDGQHILKFGFTPTGDKPFDGYPTYDTAFATDNDGKTLQLYKDSEGYYKENYVIQAKVNEEGKVECGYQNGDKFVVLSNILYNTESKKFTYTGFTNDDGSLKEYDTLYADTTDNPDEAMVFESSINRLQYNNGSNYISESGKTYNVTGDSKPLNFEGTTTAQRELYDYALAITAAYYNNDSYKAANLTYDPQYVNHYKNIFNEMRTRGYITVEEMYNVDETKASTKLKDPEWFVKQLKAGNLVLSYYSNDEKAFIGTTLDDDESVAEKEDKSAIAVAEQVYNSAMKNIESQDKQFDLQLNRLESEHNALQTEYEAVQSVIKKNVELTFKTFNG